MDYSKLTPEQLLELLKTQSPEMYNALTTPLYYPEEFPFYEPDPMSDLKFGKDLTNTIGRGYDPNLMVEDARRGRLYSSTPEADILSQLRTVSSVLDDPTDKYEFPSDEMNQERVAPIGFVDNVIDDYLPDYDDYFEENYPAYGASRYFNKVSDEDLLKLLNKKKA